MPSGFAQATTLPWNTLAGFALGAAVTSTVFAVSQARHRRQVRAIVGFALGALVKSLGYLDELLPATGPATQQLARCRDLAAAVLRLVSA